MQVFGLLAVQLALTTVIAGTFVASTTAKAFLMQNYWIVALSMIASLGCLFSMVFTSCMYATSIVVTAFAITAAMTLGLCTYALTTKEDFTPMRGMLFSCLLALLAAGFIAAVFRTPMFNLAASLGGAVLFSAFIVYDVQVMMGGSHKYQISPDEYVFAAMSIYMDVINLFLHILRILNEMRGDN
eukprot:gene27301-4604_t